MGPSVGDVLTSQRAEPGGLVSIPCKVFVCHEVRLWGLENISPPCSSDVKNEWSCTFTPLYTLMHTYGQR